MHIFDRKKLNFHFLNSLFSGIAPLNTPLKPTDSTDEKVLRQYLVRSLGWPFPVTRLAWVADTGCRDCRKDLTQQCNCQLLQMMTLILGQHQTVLADVAPPQVLPGARPRRSGVQGQQVAESEHHIADAHEGFGESSVCVFSKAEERSSVTQAEDLSSTHPFLLKSRCFQHKGVAFSR